MPEDLSNLLYKFNEILKYPIFRIQNYDISFWSIFVFLLIIYASKTLSERLSELLNHTYFKKFNIDEGRQDALRKIINYVILTFGILIALQTIGINLSALLAGGAILALGIGFGIQNLVTNFVAGILILFEQPIKKGDFVDVGGRVGSVENIAIRSTTIKTLDNVAIIIPNSKFVTEDVTNWSYGTPETRIQIEVGVSYSSDVRLVEKLLLEVAQNEDEVLKKPAPSVLFTAFGDSSLNFVLNVWILHATRYMIIESKLNFAIVEIFRKHKVEIPFPQRDINFRNHLETNYYKRADN